MGMSFLIYAFVIYIQFSEFPVGRKTRTWLSEYEMMAYDTLIKVIIIIIIIIIII